jgi:hypothetical protein
VATQGGLLPILQPHIRLYDLPVDVFAIGDHFGTRRCRRIAPARGSWAGCSNHFHLAEVM